MIFIHRILKEIVNNVEEISFLAFLLLKFNSHDFHFILSSLSKCLLPLFSCMKFLQESFFFCISELEIVWRRGRI